MAYGTLKVDKIEYSDGTNPDKDVDVADLVDAAPLTSPDFVTDITLKAQAPVKFEDDTGGEYVGLKAPTGVTTYTVSLPAAAPAADQVLKATSATALEWAADTDISGKQDLAADLTSLSSCQTGGAAALAALTSTEIEVLDGATVTTAELNILDGVTATAAELNYSDGVSSNIQTQLDAKPDLDDNQTWTGVQSGDIATIDSSAGAGWAIDFADGNNQKVTLVAANVLTVQPANQTPGQSGSIFITQPSPPLNLGWHGDWKWAAGTQPSLTQTGGATDRLDYVILAANTIHAVLTADVQ